MRTETIYLSDDGMQFRTEQEAKMRDCEFRLEILADQELTKADPINFSRSDDLARWLIENRNYITFILAEYTDLKQSLEQQQKPLNP